MRSEPQALAPTARTMLHHYKMLPLAPWLTGLVKQRDRRVLDPDASFVTARIVPPIARDSVEGEQPADIACSHV